MKSSCLTLLTFSILITLSVSAQNPVDDYLAGVDSFELIATASDGLDNPTDLDFYPDQNVRPMELWVINQGNAFSDWFDGSGGNTLTVVNADQSSRFYDVRTDGNNWHFMANPSGIAFGDNGDWATSAEIVDANRQGSTFAGPSLWPGDMTIYAQVGDPPSQQVNGSHLDMVHQSPLSMGICHEVDNVYWVADGYNGNLVRYDFQQPHYPGGSNHDDAIVERFMDADFNRVEGVPSHLVLDKANDRLFYIDGANSSVMMLDINSGTSGQASQLDQSFPAEFLTEYNENVGATVVTYIDSGLITPSGIDYHDGRLIVSDNSTGDIVIYDATGTEGTEMGRINTGTDGIMGVVVGPKGYIWYVNYDDEEVYKIAPVETEPPVSVTDVEVLQFNIFPNPAGNVVNVQLASTLQQNGLLSVYDMMGQQLLQQPVSTANRSHRLDVSTLSSGMYHVVLETESTRSQEQLVVQ